MRSSNPQFRLVHLIEVVILVSVMLAIGRHVAVNLGLPIENALPLFVPVGGGLVGAYLGFRWFRHNELSWCGLKALALAVVMTTVGLIPVVFGVLREMPNPRFRSAGVVEGIRLLAALALMGGIVAALVTLLIVPAARVLGLSHTRNGLDSPSNPK